MRGLLIFLRVLILPKRLYHNMIFISERDIPLRIQLENNMALAVLKPESELNQTLYPQLLDILQLLFLEMLSHLKYEVVPQDLLS